MKRRTLDIPEVAKGLGIGRTAAYEAARTGDIPTIRIGRRILVSVTVFEDLLAVKQRHDTRTLLATSAPEKRTHRRAYK